MIYEEIKNQGYYEIRRARDHFKSNVEAHLKENHLDGIVERVRDGRKGKLVMALDVQSTLGYELRFYPITKRGTTSQKADGFIGYDEDIRKTYKEAVL